MFKLMEIAVKDIYRKTFKTVIFSLIIAVCISGLMLSFSLNKSIDNAVESSINSFSNREIIVGINNPEGKSSEEYINYLKSIPHIKDVYKFAPKIMAVIKNDSLLSRGSFVLNSGDNDCFPKITEGLSFGDKEKNVAVIPKKVYIQNGMNRSMETVQGSSLIGKTFVFIYRNKDGSSEYSYDCKIVGIYKNQLGNTTNSIFIPLNDMYEISAKSGHYESKSNLIFTVIADKQQFADSIIKQLSSSGSISAKLYDSSGSNENSTYKLVSKINSYMVYLILASLFLILYLCVTNLAISNKNQIALYKALGYNNRHIFYIVFSESLIISLIGYLGGIIITLLAVSLFINPILYKMAQLTLSLFPPLLSFIIPFISIILTAFMVSMFSYFRVKNIYPAILLKQD